MIDHLTAKEKKLPKMKQAVLQASRRGFTIDDEGVVYRPDGSVQKLNKTSKGYLKWSVSIPKDGKSNGSSCESIPLKVHQFQAYKKFGDAFFDVPLVRHLDDIRTNNNIKNIELGTHRSNFLDMPEEKRKKFFAAGTKASVKARKARGELNLTDKDKKIIDRLFKKGEGVMAICRAIRPNEIIDSNSNIRSSVRHYLRK